MVVGEETLRQKCISNYSIDDNDVVNRKSGRLVAKIVQYRVAKSLDHKQDNRHPKSPLLMLFFVC